MELQFTIRSLLNNYHKILFKHPLVSALSMLASIALYIVLLGYFGIIETPSWFGTNARLFIVIQPTEKYDLGERSLTIKRVIVENGKRVLKNLSVEVNAPHLIEEVKLNSNLDAPCNSNRTNDGRDTVFKIHCSSFPSGERLEVTLLSKQKIESRERIQVVATGTDENGKVLTGNSATGTID